MVHRILKAGRTARSRTADALERLAARLRGGPTLATAIGEFELHAASCGRCTQTTAINWRLCGRGGALYDALLQAKAKVPA